MINYFLKNFIGRNNESKRLRWLENILGTVPAGSRLLDVGAGELRNRLFCPQVNYVSQDFCQYEGRGDGSALQMGEWNTSSINIVSDICNIPATDSSFDVIVCTEVLEHVPDPFRAILEMNRLLKINGQIIITAPFCSLTHFAPYYFSTGLSKYWYEKHLTDLGYSIVEMTPNGGWMDYLAQELWRLPWVGGAYSLRILGLIALMLSLPLLAVLFIMKFFDKGSSDLLTFGWMVVARKNN